MSKSRWREKLKEWYGGPVTHMHLRLDRETQANYISWEEHQLTIRAAVEYISRLQGRAAQVHDSNHATVEIAKRQTAGVVWSTDTNKLTPSIELHNRMHEIRLYHPESSVLTGIEADIIDVQGNIDITPEIASKTGLVIASYHRDEGWFPPDNEDGVKEIIASMTAAAANPNVDIIGHPTRLSRGTVGYAKPEMFDELGRALIKSGGVFEINLSQFSPENADTQQLLLSVISRMAILGVTFSIGSDFHHTSYLGIAEYFDQIITTENVNIAFNHNSTKGCHTAFIRDLCRVVKKLESVGVTSDMIVNRSPEAFAKWMVSRHV